MSLPNPSAGSRASRARNSRLRAVIVDWAGTIIDYGSRAPAGAFVELLGRHGVALTVAEARGPMGTAKRDHIAALCRLESAERAWRARHDRDITEADIDMLYREFIPLQMECLPDHAALIPGAAEAALAFRARGLAVGSTTGYSREMANIVDAAARRQGLTLDCVITASDVAAGRPAPWMALAAAAKMGVYPMRAIVKIGDTIADIDEGRNAGMWTIAVTATGNELGLSAAEAAALPAGERAERLALIAARMREAGAHHTAESIADCLPVLDEIEAALARGERP